MSSLEERRSRLAALARKELHQELPSTPDTIPGKVTLPRVWGADYRYTPAGVERDGIQQPRRMK